MKKVCTHCKEEKDLSEFYARTKKYPIKMAECKLCKKAKVLDRHHSKPSEYQVNSFLLS